MTASADLPFTRVHHLPRVGSTSDLLGDLVAADPRGWPHFSVVVADHQVAGRGRSGRAWQTPPGSALTASLLLRPRAGRDRWGWIPLLAGLAVARSLRALGLDAALKWPNDVVVPATCRTGGRSSDAVAGEDPESGPDDVAGWGSWRKIAGILAETSRGGPGAVILGIGVNVRQSEQELPVPWATSVARSGVPVPAVWDLLVSIGGELTPLLRRWEAAGGDAEGSGLADEVRRRCLTIGRRVDVERPGADALSGEAVGIDSDGRLLLRGAAGVIAVSSGDVRHVRRAASASREP